MNGGLLGSKQTLGHLHQWLKGGLAAGPAPTTDDTAGTVFQPRMVCEGTPQGPH